MKAIITLFLALFFSTFHLGCTSNQSSDGSNAEQKPLVVFLVRHAEKATLTEDPELSDKGKERALELAKILRSTNIEYIHISDYIRTRETAAPAAKEFGITPEIYEVGDLKALVRKLRSKGGNHLVVGHSNTTPKVVDYLGCDPGSKINEVSEYDRLYIVTDSGDGFVSSILMRYGRPYHENGGK